jgi:hypothetical protein
MSLIDQALKANEQFARKYDPNLGGRPQPKIAIVPCMDPRLSDLEGILGLKTADMDVIRTGDGRTCRFQGSWAARRSCSSTTRAAGSQPALTRS